ncbi:MAG TPA: hypothetical protein VFE37_03155 [Chloroflexota bacterium]|nr:hypothetical protein [Chloroflexota bacterium]
MRVSTAIGVLAVAVAVALPSAPVAAYEAPMRPVVASVQAQNPPGTAESAQPVEVTQTATEVGTMPVVTGGPEDHPEVLDVPHPAGLTETASGADAATCWQTADTGD